MGSVHDEVQDVLNGQDGATKHALLVIARSVDRELEDVIAQYQALGAKFDRLTAWLRALTISALVVVLGGVVDLAVRLAGI